MEKRDIIIKPYFGGLGDALQFSTLPEKFTEEGYDVYMSSRYVPSNVEIRSLVWGCNPYIQGWSTDEPNAGDIVGHEYKDTQGDFIMNWEAIHGLTPTNKFPKVYYKPKNIEALNNTVLIDLSCNSLKEDYKDVNFSEYLSQYKGQEVWQLYFEEIENGKKYADDLAFVGNIYEYCDYIFSCKKFVCLSSGGNSLASALKEYGDIDVDCLVTHSPTIDSMYGRKLYFYDNINYVWV